MNRTHEPPGALPSTATLPVCRHEWTLFFAVDLGMTRDEIFHCSGCGTVKHEVRCDGKMCEGYPRFLVVTVKDAIS